MKEYLKKGLTALACAGAMIVGGSARGGEAPRRYESNFMDAAVVVLDGSNDYRVIKNYDNPCGERIAVPRGAAVRLLVTGAGEEGKKLVRTYGYVQDTVKASGRRVTKRVRKRKKSLALTYKQHKDGTFANDNNIDSFMKHLPADGYLRATLTDGGRDSCVINFYKGETVSGSVNDFVDMSVVVLDGKNVIASYRDPCGKRIQLPKGYKGRVLVRGAGPLEKSLERSYSYTSDDGKSNVDEAEMVDVVSLDKQSDGTTLGINHVEGFMPPKKDAPLEVILRVGSETACKTQFVR